VVESTLDDPRQIIAAQENKARGEAVAEMKRDGIEYEERMERLQEITYPKPLEELLGHAYEVYRQAHPWIGDYPLRPKTVARDLYERAMTFADYVGFYELARTEGLVLRYLAGAYKALEHTVPDDLKSEDLRDLISWLGELVRQVDSSLLDEWEKLANPEDEEERELERLDERTAPVTANVRAFRVLVRNAMFRRVELAALERYFDLGELDSEDRGAAQGASDQGGGGRREGGWDQERWAEAMDGYWDEHDDLGTGPNARGPKMLIIDDESVQGAWLVRQIFDDPAGDHDWGISAEVDLASSDEEGRAVLRVTSVDRM